MNQTTATSIRLNTKIKQDAQLLAKEMGTNLSTVANILLANFVRHRRLRVDLDEEGFTPEESAQIMEAVEEHRSGKDPGILFET